MQADPQLLSVLTTISESPTFHQKVTDAQWKGVKSVKVPDFAETWSKECIQMVAHITHWGPAYGWHNNATAYKDTNGDALKIVVAFIKRHQAGPTKTGPFLF